MVPPHSSATAVKGGPNNDTLFLFGGFTVDQTMALVYTFDSRSIIWSIPKIAGVTFRKWDLTSIINKDGRMYLWSGETNTDYDYAITYNANTLNIDKGTGLILSEYDIINDNWDTKATSGKIPSNRAGFSAILDTTLYVLDLANYNWYIPKISGKILKPRVFHKANDIVMIKQLKVGDILLLDISNNEEYIWTTIFDPKMPSPPPSTLPPLPLPSPPPSPSLSSSSPPNNSGNIAGIVVGSLLSGILLSVGSFLIYKWNKNKLKTIHKNDKNNDYSQEEKELPIQETIQIDQIPRNESTSNYEPIIIPPPIINKNNYHKQEIILTPENENTTNHEPIIIPANDHHGQEIMQTLQNENNNDHEPTIPAPAVVNTNSYNNNRASSQIFKDEILQAVKNEIGQNLKNEFLQAVKNEIGQNLKNELLQAVREDNLNITRNNTKQD
uniref:Uncharacterized protein n=1 Tax=Rhizophagus irregularis (strain DAOM 181602 / DAOM 197198 / MUCL 43194) TaxID=747089 RepID=U9TLK4_RHIID